MIEILKETREVCPNCGQCETVLKCTATSQYEICKNCGSIRRKFSF